jgi:hypothetical protein
VGLVCLLALSVVGCGSDNAETTRGKGRTPALREVQEAKAEARAERRAKRRIEARARARVQAAKAEARRERAAKRRAVAQAESEVVELEEDEEGAKCDSSYEGACLDPNASDYDCEGGSGDGPLYTGFVIVVGEDHYGLDSDSDGEGCE